MGGPTTAESKTPNFIKSLKRAKLFLVSLALIFVSLVLYFIAGMAEKTSTGTPTTQPGSSPNGLLRRVPWKDVASTALTTGVVVLVFEVYLRRESEESLKRLLGEEVAGRLRTTVMDSLRVADQVAKVPLADAELDKIALNCLIRRSGDREAASGAFQVVRDSLLEVNEHWRQLRATVTFFPLGQEYSDELRSNYFDVHMRFEYLTTMPKTSLRFTVTLSRDDYAKRILSHNYDVIWNLKQWPGVPVPNAEEVFSVSSAAIDGVPLDLKKDANDLDLLGQLPTNAPSRVGGWTSIAYSFRVLVRRRGHILTLELPRPCKSASYAVYFGNCGIDRMSVADLFTSSERSAVNYTPSADNFESLTISVPGWIIPRSGVVLVWALKPDPRPRRESRVRRDEHGSPQF